MSKMNIVFDIDGFNLPIEKSQSKRFISVELEKQPIDTLIEQYYIGFRSAFYICEDSITDEKEAYKTMTLWRENSLKSAMLHSKLHSENKKVPAPDFIWIIKDAILDELRNNYPIVGDIEIRISMKPRISARAVSNRIISFPALSRSVVLQYNLAIVNSIYRDMNEEGEILNEPDIRNIARIMFPYFLFCHDEFSVSNLPMYCAYSLEAIKYALKLTTLQMMFILAHEYAHILLGHHNKVGNNVEIETEADIFAIKVIVGFVNKYKEYTKLDAFTAIRWLYKYQLLEESVGILARAGTLDFNKSKHEERRGKSQLELLNKYGLKGSSLFETRGFYILVELQSVLYEQGSDLINYIINKINESVQAGVVEPWWEKIKNK